MKTELQELLDFYLRELLQTLANEATRNIAFSLIDVSNPAVAIRDLVKCSGSEAESATIEIRVYRRQSDRPSRFTLQAVTHDLSPDSGFSGFTVSGRFESPEGIEILSRTNNYNYHEWESKLVV